MFLTVGFIINIIIRIIETCRETATTATTISLLVSGCSPLPSTCRCSSCSRDSCPYTSLCLLLHAPQTTSGQVVLIPTEVQDNTRNVTLSHTGLERASVAVASSISDSDYKHCCYCYPCYYSCSTTTATMYLLPCFVTFSHARGKNYCYSISKLSARSLDLARLHPPRSPPWGFFCFSGQVVGFGVCFASEKSKRETFTFNIMNTGVFLTEGRILGIAGIAIWFCLRLPSMSLCFPVLSRPVCAL